MNDELVLVEKDGAVGIVHLNRPDKLNALSPDMMEAMASAVEGLDADEDIRVIILVGSERVFAAGADIEAMSKMSAEDMNKANTMGPRNRIRDVSKPTIAAVSGFVFGGGCELAMQCDMIVASETAKFGQPEIKLGIIPGAGGTQRLIKAMGPYKAMEMVLTGEPIDAQTAYELNLVNRVVPVERFLEEAKELARVIAERPPLAVKAARDAVRKGTETTLKEGFELERENFINLFDTEDQAEGMKAFIEKRKPKFKGK